MFRIGSLLSLVLAALWLDLAPASAQRADIATTQQRFDDFYAKGRYTEALAEAKKLEALERARAGAQSVAYAEALVAQGRAEWKLGRNREAEELCRRALPILRRVPAAARSRGR